jgi:lipoic acid synthetase
MTRYYHPDEFKELKRIALSLGFVHVEAGPLVRSSYHAHEQADAYEESRTQTAVRKDRGFAAGGPASAGGTACAGRTG